MPTRTTLYSGPPLLSYDFMEVYGGSGKVSAVMAKKGMRVGPAIDLSASLEFDVGKVWVLDWLLFLVMHRLRSLLIEVRTTFSTAAWPCLRSHAMPLGFGRKHPHTRQSAGFQGLPSSSDLLVFWGPMRH